MPIGTETNSWLRKFDENKWKLDEKCNEKCMV